MMLIIKKLSDTTKGVLLIIMGSVLFLYALGILAVSLHFLVFLFAAALIAAGIYLVRDKVAVLIKIKNNKE